MPKIKTNRSGSKRFKRTASGKFKRKKSGARHLLTCKPPKRRRKLRGATNVSKSDAKRVQGMLPNG